MKGYNQGDMKPEVKDFQKPASCYSQSYVQSPLNYVERNDKLQAHEAKKVSSQAHKGRY